MPSSQSGTGRWALATLAAALTVAGCHASDAATPAPTTSTAASGDLPVGDSAAAMPGPGTCKLGSRDGQPMPDPNCTPGAVNPAVRQDTIKDTICQTGWTKTVRPSTSKTSTMKAASARSYNLTPGAKSEYDHLVSLELGGAPDDPRNLWVEPGTIPNPKDAVENKLHAAVCSGLIQLAPAQKAIASNWVTAFDTVGLRVAGGKVCLRDKPTSCVNGHRGDEDGN
ncbi:hypothetical protein [Amycolatopsis vastitatis]|uniref:HNH endonuclease n=1 Tax=Amycolatopsis vastitatis TaxID=1905142 RepID=A0A229SQJ3_9PSEU|nr:hypothetical protein [Amycolatopsis vastitatis]OXM61345.1 hypothetical protein CF165_38340 [Amycolatopsis vastitatis]